MRVIDADELFRKLATLSVDTSSIFGKGRFAGISDISQLIANTPTINLAEQGYISKTELLVQLDEYMKYYDLTDDYTGDDIEDAMSSTVYEIKEMIGLYPNWDKWHEEGE